MKWLWAFAISAVIGLCLVPPAPGQSRRMRLVPQLRPGQTFDYLLNFQSDRDIKTESRVVVPNLPVGEKIAVLARIHVEVLVQQNTGFRLRATLELTPSSSPATTPGAKPAPSAATPPKIEFTLRDNGAVEQVNGMDALPAGQQAAWQEWVARFAASLVYPQSGIKPGDKWESQEQENAPSPIAGLIWLTKSQYVRDAPCPLGRTGPQGDLTEETKGGETCAVILTTATLKQKSSPKDATPENYKLHHLQTKGTVVGKNETILYISRATGLLMRSSETAAQSMDVTISLADGSNQVHYNVQATSHARMIFLQTSTTATR